MMVVSGPGGDEAGAQFVRLGMRHFEGRDLLQVLMQEPGVVEQHFQDQRLPPRQRRALAAEQGARCKLGGRGLVGTWGKGQARGLCKTSAAATTRSKIAAARL